MQASDNDRIEELAIKVASKLNSVDPHILEGLRQWNLLELQTLVDCLSETTLKAVASELLASQLPNNKLPLRTSRYPFQDCSIATVEKIIVSALTYPEKEGDLSALALERLGLTRKRPRDYFIIEAHFNITELTAELFNTLVCLGFEPDNFFKLQPKCYKHNLTLAFAPSRRPRQRFDYLRGIVAARSESAAELVQNSARVSGFFESEIYPSSWIKRYRFRPPAEGELAKFPFKAGSFDVMRVPQRLSEVQLGGLSLESRKLADIHVKIPTEVRAQDYPGATAPSVLKLREQLMEIGFYEIISESGNAIYTGQFVSSKEATDVFKSLDGYAKRFGGILDLVCEPCTAFWRKEECREVTEGGRVLAEVSPILSLSNRPLEIAG